MRIEVTQEDIANGNPNDAYACPIQRAITRAGIENTVAITYCTAYHVNGKVWQEILLPDECAAFVRSFDAGGVVYPFSFELPIKPATKATT